MNKSKIVLGTWSWGVGAVGNMNFLEVFDRDLLDYLARRYNTTVKRVVSQFMKQSDIEKEDYTEYGFILEANEVEILRDYYLRSAPVL